MAEQTLRPPLLRLPNEILLRILGQIAADNAAGLWTVSKTCSALRSLTVARNKTVFKLWRDAVFSLCSTPGEAPWLPKLAHAQTWPWLIASRRRPLADMSLESEPHPDAPLATAIIIYRTDIGGLAAKRSALFAALKAGNISIANMLVKAGAPLDCVLPHRFSLVQYFAYFSNRRFHLEALEFLLTFPEIRSTLNTPLRKVPNIVDVTFQMYMEHRTTIVISAIRLLILAGGRPSIPERLIFFGAFLDDLDIARIAIEENPKCIHFRNREYMTPLKFAVERLSVKMCQLLIESGADPNAYHQCNSPKDSYDYYSKYDPVIYTGDECADNSEAVESANGSAVECSCESLICLISKRLSISSHRDQESSRKIFNLLMESGIDLNKGPVLYTVLLLRELKLFVKLVKSGLDPNIVHNSIYAYGPFNTLTVLIEQKQDFLRPFNRLELIQLVIDHGANTSAISRYGKSLLQLACNQPEFRDIVNKLLDNGASVAHFDTAKRQIITDLFKNPAFRAWVDQDTDQAAIFIKRLVDIGGADLNAVYTSQWSYQGPTPLQYFISQGWTCCAKLLTDLRDYQSVDPSAST